MSDEGGRDLSQANPLNKAIHGSKPGIPREIRARTGQTEDPIPDGKHLEEHKVRLPVATQEEDDGPSPAQIAAIAAGAHPDSAKEDKKRHKEELQRLHGGALHSGGKDPHTSKLNQHDMKNAGNKNMDSRRAHFGQPQTNRSQS